MNIKNYLFNIIFNNNSLNKKIKLIIIIITILLLIIITYFVNIEIIINYIKNSNIYLIVTTHILFAIFVLPCSYFVVLYSLHYIPLYSVIFIVMVNLLCVYITYYIGFILSSSLHENYNLLTNTKYTLVKNKVENAKWYTISFFCINPLIPGASLGYVFGIFKINLITLTIGVILGSLPGAVFISYATSIALFFL